MSDAEVRKLSYGAKLGFGVGQFGEGVCRVVFGTYMLFFYNQVIGISATLTGIALAIALVFDAISDPVAGSISDRWKSKWGRRHPFITGSAIPLALSIIALFNPPGEMHELFYFGWLTLFAVAARLFLTLYHVPHMALGAEMAHEYSDRTRVYSYSELFGTIGSAGFAFLVLTYIFPSIEGASHGMLNEAGYPPFSMTAGATIIITILLCAWGTRKEIPYLPSWDVTEERLSLGRLWREVRTALGSRSYRMLLCGLLSAMLLLSYEGSLMVYIYVHFWELPTESMRWLGPAALIALPISAAMTPPLTRMFDKRTILLCFGSITIINMNLMIMLRLFTPFTPDNGDPMLLYMLLGVAFFSGLVGPALMITFNSMFADVADELELRTGGRQEGMIFSARSFSFKASGALATVIGGIALDLIAFPRAAEAGAVPAEIVFRLGVVAGPVTLVLGLLAMLFYLAYQLDRKRMAEIRDELAKRRAAQHTGGQRPD
ncbi:MAG: MFS transporter [Pseudomonadales bacterium]|nr:MFS transporter [Pseudomonadales bacterium]